MQIWSHRMFSFDKDKFKGICVPYARFSTAQQDKVGRKSLDRQVAEAKRYSLQNNLYFNDELVFADKGLSGYALQGDSSKGFKTGQMQLMLSLLDQIPVEEREFVYITFHNFDRFSRMSPEDAQRHFTTILKKGFNIVTTIDDQVYTRHDHDMEKMIVSIIHMSTAHYESQVKSLYVADAYQRKRDVIEYLYNSESQKGKHKHIGIKAYCPTWIRQENIHYTYTASDGSEKVEALRQFTVDEEKAKVVNLIFDLKIQGLGHTRICQILNQQGIDTFQQGNFRKAKNWHIFAIHNLFKNEHVLGHTYLHRRNTVESFDDDEGQFKSEKVKQVATAKLYNYYPQIVSDEKYQLALLKIDENNLNKNKKVGKDKTHLFSHLMTCGCGGRMVFKSTKKNNVKKVDDYFEYLRCEKSILKDGCNAENINYKSFEQSFVKYAKHIDFANLVVAGESDGTLKQELLDKHEGAIQDLAALKKKSDGLSKTFNSAIGKGLDASFVLDQISVNEKKMEEISERIEALSYELNAFAVEETMPVDSVLSMLKSKRYDDVLSSRKQMNDFLKSKVRLMQVCSTKVHKFVIICFNDNVIRTFAYEDEFANDLMFNSIRINTDGLTKPQTEKLLAGLINVVRMSLEGKTEVITNTDLVKFVADYKNNSIKNWR